LTGIEMCFMVHLVYLCCSRCYCCRRRQNNGVTTTEGSSCSRDTRTCTFKYS